MYGFQTFIILYFSMIFSRHEEVTEKKETTNEWMSQSMTSHHTRDRYAATASPSFNIIRLAS
jgi:hypothetical protein